MEQTQGEKEALQAEVKDLDEALDDLRQQIIDRNLMIEGRETAVNVEKSKVREREKKNSPASSAGGYPSAVYQPWWFQRSGVVLPFPSARLKRCESR